MLAERTSQRGIARALKVSLDTVRSVRKKSVRIEAEGPLAKVAAPEDDVIEIDEICVRVSPSFWVWMAVSRLVGQVLSFIVGDRTDAMLEAAWSDVPEDYHNKLVKTDHWEAYKQFFPPEQHEACDKGSGETSHAESRNTKLGECLHSLWR